MAIDGDEDRGAAAGRSQTETQAMPVVPGRTAGQAAAGAATAGDEAEPGGDAERVAEAIGRGGRYRIEALLGEGGMGRVFRAHDTQLNRTVAIKVLAAFDAAAAARLAREARLQARVEHPNVAKVYESGESAGVRFLAMQHIPGRPLGEIAGAMSAEQRVRIVQRVAEGLHEAHRLGLVHGDIKPSNILVVDEGNGLWHPYVLDFGIARETAAPGFTVAGVVSGTPAYMAPEQARGETLDRRTDVYALGVTLYRLLSGTLPFSDRGSVDTLVRVLHDDPAPLRQRAPQVAPDLEAIVMKCLEKQPARRYATARALADDLVRWLDGEPVLARRQTLLYRLARKARKNRALVGVSAAAVAGVLLATGWAVRERLQTGRRAAIAQRFGQEEERFEWTLRAAYELPLHDTSPERDAVRAAIERLERDVRELPAAVRAPGDAAIGRGYMALGDEVVARRHLESAWKSGYRAPEVAYALGLALVHAYQQALAHARLAQDAAERRLALESAQRGLRDPAVAYLRASRGGEFVASDYLEGLLAYLAGDAAATRRQAEAAIGRLPWLYEALALEAQAWRITADREEDEARRGDALAHAEAALTRACRLGESDARTYLALCETEVERLRSAIDGSGAGVEGLFGRAAAACAAALTAEPQLTPALALQAQALTLAAGYDLDHGGDPEPRLRQAEAAARAAMRLRGDEAQPYRALASVASLRARALRMHGGDVQAALTPAIASLHQALLRDAQDWQSLAALGSALSQRGVDKGEHGGDAAASFRGAAEALEKAAALEPRLYTTFFNLGHTYSDWGEYLAGAGKDPSAVQARAIASYRRAITLKPDYAQAYNSLGAVLMFRASAPRPSDQPLALLAAAEAALRKAIEIQPGYANPRFNLGLAYREMGTIDADGGRDPWPRLRQAIEAFREGLRLNPKIFFAYLEMGRIYVVGGGYDVDHHRSPQEAVSEAVRLADRSLAMQPDDFMALKARGEARMLSAAWAIDQKRSPEPDLAPALTDFERASRMNSNDFGVYELLGQVSLLSAKGRLAAGLPIGRQVELGLQRIATGRRIAGEDQSGLSRIDGELYLVRARAEAGTAAGAAAARQAVTALEAAVQRRRTLAAQVAPSLVMARRLAGGVEPARDLPQSGAGAER